jgi:type II secretory pathway component GspD/PulD (secretin)
MRAAGVLRSERSLRMVTLDGQPVTAQIGRNQPRVVGVSNDSRRGQTSSLVMEPIGIKIRALPQIDSDDHIQVSMDIGESNVEKSTDVTLSITAEGGPQFADVVTTRQFNTTARTKSGSAVLLKRDASFDSEAAPGAKTELIILGAEVVDASE